MKEHVDWLTSIGMVVNVNKTEAVLFSRSKETVFEFMVNGIKVNTSHSMIILGIEFDCHMSWSLHVDNVIKKAKKKIQGLRILI